MNELTVLVCSCDKYEDLWYPFFSLLHKYWPDCKCRIILNTETKKYEYPGLNIEAFSLYENTNTPYGKRMRDHLKRITTPFTLLMLDDFFVREPIDVETLKTVIRYMMQNPKIATFNFDCINEPQNKTCEYEGFVERGVIGHYKLNMQAGIWRTDVLLGLWKDSDTPWGWEIYGTTRAFNNRHRYYCLSDLTKSPIKYGHDEYGKGFGVYRGKWDKDDVCPLFSKENIVVNYDTLGFYDENEQHDVIGTSKMQKIQIAYRALSFKYFFVWLSYTAINKLRKVLGLNPYEGDYIDHLIRMNKQ